MIMEHRLHLFERRAILLVTPRPVAMDIGVVGVQSLIGGQARSKREIAFVVAVRRLHVNGPQSMFKAR